MGVPTWFGCNAGIRNRFANGRLHLKGDAVDAGDAMIAFHLRARPERGLAATRNAPIPAKAASARCGLSCASRAKLVLRVMGRKLLLTAKSSRGSYRLSRCA